MAELYVLPGTFHAYTQTSSDVGENAAYPVWSSFTYANLIQDHPRTTVGGFPALSSFSSSSIGFASDLGFTVSIGWPYPVSLTNVSFNWTTWRTGSGGNVRHVQTKLYHLNGTTTVLKGVEDRNSTTMKAESLSGTWADVISVAVAISIRKPSSGTNAGNLNDISLTGTYPANRMELQFADSGVVYGTALFHPTIAAFYVSAAPNRRIDGGVHGDTDWVLISDRLPIAPFTERIWDSHPVRIRTSQLDGETMRSYRPIPMTHALV